ncbi:hypothetical protein E3N88_08393 [Mikania micrantha]|uniref:Uncharacterized protein n=1 Tax=Mikania micrantha TaxID=192012 RepID=A0A5N6PH18_9ASTR|nr:hypothetical protein E3N88_08393 [Mikania micrantha]
MVEIKEKEEGGTTNVDVEEDDGGNLVGDRNPNQGRNDDIYNTYVTFNETTTSDIVAAYSIMFSPELRSMTISFDPLAKGLQI